MTNQLHHLITLACNKACSYCINDLKEFGDSENKRHASLDAIEAEYARLSKHYSGIRISGGEPTKYKHFQAISRLARRYFPYTELITANPDLLTESFDWVDEVYDLMYFSLHEPYIAEFCKDGSYANFNLLNNRSKPVILSCLTDLFERMVVACDDQSALLQQMLGNGFYGLTVRQEWPDGKPLRILLPTYANFSVRYNPKQQCESQLLLMPNLSTIDNRMVTTSLKVTPVNALEASNSSR